MHAPLAVASLAGHISWPCVRCDGDPTASFKLLIGKGVSEEQIQMILSSSLILNGDAHHVTGRSTCHAGSTRLCMLVCEVTHVDQLRISIFSECHVDTGLLLARVCQCPSSLSRQGPFVITLTCVPKFRGNIHKIFSAHLATAGTEHSCPDPAAVPQPQNQ